VEQIRHSSGRSEYAVAFRSIRASKNLAAAIVAICILLQIGVAAAVHFAKVLETAPTNAPAVEDNVDEPVAKTDAEATTRPADQAEGSAVIWREALHWGLPATRFAAMAVCLVLVLMVMFAVKLALIERVGGVAGFIAAFNWSAILLVMLVPWKPILGSAFSCGALFNLGELEAADAALGAAPDLFQQAMFYGRFIAYPAVALFICLIVQVKFAKGYAVANFTPADPQQSLQGAARPVPPQDPTDVADFE